MIPFLISSLSKFTAFKPCYLQEPLPLSWVHLLLVKVLLFTIVMKLYADRSDLFYLIIHNVGFMSGLYSQSPNKKTHPTRQKIDNVSVLHRPETVKTETLLNDDES